MFTGIIEGLGSIAGIRPSGGGARITVAADFALEGTKVGDSLAVNGACLTAVRLDGRRFQADISPETFAKTTLGDAGVGHRVNLERALMLSGRIDGHLVSGHVDGTGVIREKRTADNALWVAIEIPASLSRYIIRKGSVAVDGISLTVNRCGTGTFEVAVIPHTARITTLGDRKPGDRVNIETDLIGKYVERFLVRDEDSRKSTPSAIDMDFLARSGFLDSSR